jgi:hypothetical protein
MGTNAYNNGLDKDSPKEQKQLCCFQRDDFVGFEYV